MARRGIGLLLPGAAVAAVGAFVGVVALTYPLGSALRPGPGYFPMIVAGLLILLGIAVAVETRRYGAGDEEAEAQESWRPLVATSAALLIFALTLEPLGYIAASVLLVFVATLGERRRNWWTVLAIAGFMAIFGTLVFITGLGLPIDPLPEF